MIGITVIFILCQYNSTAFLFRLILLYDQLKRRNQQANKPFSSS